MNRKNILAIFAAAAVAGFGLAGPAAHARQGTMKTPPVNNTVSPVDKMFIKAATQGNMAEIMTSQLALKKTKNNNVRMIAEMLIKDHGKALEDLKPVAQSAKVMMPKKPNAEQRAMYAMLSRKSGRAFDKAYMAGQVKAHLETIGLFQKENLMGRDKEATNYAATYLPGIQGHTSMIVETAKTVGVPLSMAARQYEKSKTGAMKMDHGAK